MRRVELRVRTGDYGGRDDRKGSARSPVGRRGKDGLCPSETREEGGDERSVAGIESKVAEHALGRCHKSIEMGS